jgi:hypothetical protein
MGAWEAEVQRRWRALEQTPDVGNASDVLLAYGSGERTEALVEVLLIVDSGLRGGILAEWWDAVESSWQWRHELLRLFRSAGYVGVEALPSTPTQLYRGVNNRRQRRGLTWTDDAERACQFALHHSSGPTPGEGYVFSVLAPPEAVLGRFTEHGQGDFVLDFERLPRSPTARVVSAGAGAPAPP